jgi:hypothetical protein
MKLGLDPRKRKVDGRINGSLAEIAMLAFLCIVSFATTLYATKSGIAFTPDSVNYLVSGLNFADGRGLTDYSGAPVQRLYAPGLSILMAAGVTIGIGAEQTVRIANALAFASIVLSSYFLLRGHLRSTILIWGGTAFIAVSTPLLLLADRALTEAIFCAITLTFLITIEQILKQPTRTAYLFIAVALAGAAFLFRYAGITLIVSGTLILLLGLWKRDRKAAIGRAATFGLASAALPLIFATLNPIVGNRGPGVHEPIEQIHRAIMTVGFWLLPGRDGAFPGAMVSKTLLTIIGVAVLLWCAAGLWYSRQTSGETTEDVAPRPIMPLTVFAGLYTAIIIFATTTASPIDQVGPRFMSPVYVPIVIFALIGADALSRQGDAARKWVFVVLGTLLSVQLWFFVATARNDSAGVDLEHAYRNNELGALVAALPDQALVYTNGPYGIWVSSRHQPIFHLPLPDPDARADTPTARVRAIQQNASCKDTYLAWLDSGSWVLPAMPVADLRKFVKLELVSQTSDGALYRIKPESVLGCK